MKNCDFHYLNKSINCNDHYHNFNGYKKLKDCQMKTDTHFKQLCILNLNQRSQISEKELILLRLGLETETSNLDEMEICPVHRATLGICWRGTTGCSYAIMILLVE